MQDTPSSPTFLGVALGSFLFGVAGLLLVLLLGVWHWEQIQVLAGGYLLGVLIPVVIGAQVVTKKPQMAIVAFIVTLIPSAGLAVWHVPQARAALVRLVGPLLPSHTLMKGLADSDEAVVTEACSQLVAKGYDEVQYIVKEFAIRPTSSITCLTRDFPGTDADELLRRDLARVWESDILENPEAKCGAVDAYAAMAPSIYTDVAARLLRLSFASASIEAKDCARKAFEDRYPVGAKRLDGLGNPNEVDHTIGAPLFDALILAGYSSTAPEVDRAMMSDPTISQWTMSLGCSLLQKADEPARTIRSLNQAMSASNCGAASGENSTSIWVQTCQDGVSETTGFVTQNKLCSLVGTYARGEAISYAQTIVHSGVELMQWRAIKDRVEQGYNAREGLTHDQRYVPTDLMEATLYESSLPVGMSHDLGNGFSAVRTYGGAARAAMQSGQIQRSGMSKVALEVFIGAGENGGEFNGVDLNDLIKGEGADPDEVFSKSNIQEAKMALKQQEEEEEDEFEFENLFGEDEDEQKMAKRMKRKRKARKKAKAEQDPAKQEVRPWDQK